MSAVPLVLSEYQRLSEPRLRAFLEAKGARLAALPVELGPAHALLTDYALRGGKRLRGALVLLGHEAAAGDPMVALDASVGLELLHTYLLVHDDFMDRDLIRRGGPTLHTSLGKLAGEHLGGSVALLLGSLCEAWAYELVLDTLVPAARTLEAAKLLTQALQEVTVGQALDLLAPLGPELLPRGVLEVQRMKTGSYTFELPLKLGAVLAGGSPALIDALGRFARPLGQAFQIADDLLGTFGTPDITGKSDASDLREGKRTLLVARALEMAEPADREKLRQGLGKPDANVHELRAIVRRSGAEANVRAVAERLCAEAVRALAVTAVPVPVAEDLREIAQYSVQRAL